MRCVLLPIALLAWTSWAAETDQPSEERDHRLLNFFNKFLSSSLVNRRRPTPLVVQRAQRPLSSSTNVIVIREPEATTPELTATPSSPTNPTPPVVTTTTAPPTPPTCPPMFTACANRCYAIFGAGMGAPQNAANARLMCQLRGARLAVVRSPAQNQCVANMLGLANTIGVFIGYMRSATSPTMFVGDDGQPLDFQNFGPMQPNNFGNMQDCMQIETPNSPNVGQFVLGQWNDESCTTISPYACEIP